MKKKTHRLVLGVGYPWFMNYAGWESDIPGDTTLSLMSGPNRQEGRKKVILNYRNKKGEAVVGAWQKVKVILEWE